MEHGQQRHLLGAEERRLMLSRGRHTGFTMIELMVAVTIVAAVVWPRLFPAMARIDRLESLHPAAET